MIHSVLVIGGSSGIGLALAQYYAAKSAKISIISRQPASEENAWHWFEDSLQSDEHSAQVVQQVLVQQPELIFICNGVLHDDNAMPEKTIRQLDNEIMMRRFYTNVAVPARYLQLLLPYLNKKNAVKVVVLSAKVGSIADNALGGWYSYRISKAALNMLVKNVSIEVRRLNASATIISVHPGTTDTLLSAPFQTNLPDGQLQTAGSTAIRLAQVVQAAQPEQSGVLFNWDGSILPF